MVKPKTLLSFFILTLFQNVFSGVFGYLDPDFPFGNNGLSTSKNTKTKFSDSSDDYPFKKTSSINFGDLSDDSFPFKSTFSKPKISKDFYDPFANDPFFKTSATDPLSNFPSSSPFDNDPFFKASLATKPLSNFPSSSPFANQLSAPSDISLPSLFTGHPEKYDSLESSSVCPICKMKHSFSKHSSSSSSSDERKNKKHPFKKPKKTIALVMTTKPNSPFGNQNLPFGAAAFTAGATTGALIASPAPAPASQRPPAYQNTGQTPSSQSNNNWPLAGAALAAGATAGALASSANKPSPASYPALPPSTAVQPPPTCNYCVRENCKPSIPPYPYFDVNKDTKALQNAFEGLGTHEDAVIAVIMNRSDKQMAEIMKAYTKSGRSLQQDIRGDTSLKFKQLLLAFATPLPLFYAKELHKALKGEDANTLIEIMTSLSDCAINEIANEYEQQYKESLTERIQKETNLKFEKFILALAKGNRNKNKAVDEAAAKRDALALIKAGVGKWFGTDADTFIDIFSTRSFPQLREVLKQYDAMRKSSSIDKDVDDEFSGKLEKGLLNLIKNIKNQPAFFADELDDALDGWVGPADNDKLVRIMRGRSGIDLEDIRQNFDTRYPKPLQKRINEETYFEYRRALNAIISPKN